MSSQYVAASSTASEARGASGFAANASAAWPMNSG
jgi:hypothetical protein